MEFLIYFEKIFCGKRNASTSLGIEPRTFRLPVECSIIWATEIPHNFFHRIYLRHFGYGYIMNYLLMFPNYFSWLRRSLKKCITHYTIPTLSTCDLELTSFKTRWNFQYVWKNFLWKMKRFHSAGYRAQDLSIAGRMLNRLSYGSSTQLFS